MEITKQDFLDWKQDRITKEFFSAILERIEDGKDILATQAGLDPITDNFYRGFIYAYKEALEFRVDSEEEN
jgi:hypothetical protein